MTMLIKPWMAFINNELVPGYLLASFGGLGVGFCNRLPNTLQFCIAAYAHCIVRNGYAEALEHLADIRESGSISVAPIERHKYRFTQQ